MTKNGKETAKDQVIGFTTIDFISILMEPLPVEHISKMSGIPLEQIISETQVANIKPLKIDEVITNFGAKFKSILPPNEFEKRKKALKEQTNSETMYFGEWKNKDEEINHNLTPAQKNATDKLIEYYDSLMQF